jgi:hypothetical protein
MRKRIAAMLMIGTAAALLAAAGCGGNDNGAKDEPPDLPTTASMHMNLDYFGSTKPLEAEAPATKLNFANAAARVALVNLAVTVYMIPPEVALGLALHTVPSPQSDSSWVWIYTYTHDGTDYQLRLRGKRNGDAVNWEMYTVPPEEDAQLWFSGWSNATTHQGNWTFHDFKRDGDPEVLTADWLATSATDAFLDITITDQESDYYATTVTYLADSTSYSLEFFDSSTAKSWRVDWNIEDGTGSLTADGLNNGDPLCWDADRNDVDCPPAAARPSLRRAALR